MFLHTFYVKSILSGKRWHLAFKGYCNGKDYSEPGMQCVFCQWVSVFTPTWAVVGGFLDDLTGALSLSSAVPNLQGLSEVSGEVLIWIMKFHLHLRLLIALSPFCNLPFFPLKNWWMLGPGDPRLLGAQHIIHPVLVPLPWLLGESNFIFSSLQRLQKGLPFPRVWAARANRVQGNLSTFRCQENMDVSN